MPQHLGSAFQTAQARNAEQQRALLASIAEAGSAGASAYQQAQAQNQQLQQAALSQASGIGGPSPDLNGVLALNQASLGNQQTSFNQDIARQSAANADYMNQVGAAIPVVAERTKLGVEQTLADLQAKREQQALALQQSQLSLQEQQLALQTAKANAAASGNNGGLTAYQAYQIAANEKQAQLDQQKQAQAEKIQADKEKKDRQAKYLESLAAANILRPATDTSPVQFTQGFNAINAVASGIMTIDEALDKYRIGGKPNGKKLNRQFIERQVAAINNL